MKKQKKFITAQDRKERNAKIGEIVWLVISGIFLFSGVVFGILHLIAANITGNQTKSPFYFLIQFRNAYGEWVVTWWKNFAKGEVFLITALFSLLVGLIIVLITLFITSNRQESVNKKEAARLLRERNIRKFEAAQGVKLASQNGETKDETNLNEKPEGVEVEPTLDNSSTN